jgi:hypothetical protein
MNTLHRLRKTGDRGAVATIVAVLLAGGVLLGMGALTIDVGRLYAEREELQSGADAAALAVAKLCADSPADCAGSATGTAEGYADDNARDGASSVSVLCGRLPDGALPACPPPAGNLTRCVTEPPADMDYVEVRTSTELPGGSTLLPPSLAQTMLGKQGYQGSRVGACARAGLGPPVPVGGLAVTISVCEWQSFTDNGATFPEYPPDPPASYDKAVYLHSTSDADTCPAGPSGWDEPGGFGWLDEDGGSCQSVIDENGTVGGNTGTSVTGTCQEVLQEYYASHEVLFIPVFDGVQGTGAGTTYHVLGMAAFVLTGYSLPGFRQASWLSGGHLCPSASDKCLYGFFTEALIPTTGPVGGPDLGATVVTLIG